MDEYNRITSVFWTDPHSRAACEEFGDVVSFDTTYLTNKYDMPFAPFVGVNHHGQSILLGCGLLSAEDTLSFVWLFKCWLRCMGNKAPYSIVTDQCKAMANAIEDVFPKTKHRWCLWHIMKKIPEKFQGYNNYVGIKCDITSVVYDSGNATDFDIGWKRLLTTHGLQNNEWLCNLYEERQKWVPCYLKNHFWADMSTTQRSEGMNAFFDGFINSSTTLQQFVVQCNKKLLSGSIADSLKHKWNVVVLQLWAYERLVLHDDGSRKEFPRPTEEKLRTNNLKIRKVRDEIAAIRKMKKMNNLADDKPASTTL
ncbi:protein FAR1-RELATED SEQUENCE 5-like [Vigna umbellata]|uniref:protein FAR1-RELATED SEQUENCE 5-like n=1 Tax=Vigna umbellata TaxID=87088 RepID=UPI001F5E52AF|nr:protein FAR1-RELATED SEQUENCE 5-like [Vigna umbellata]